MQHWPHTATKSTPPIPDESYLRHDSGWVTFTGKRVVFISEAGGSKWLTCVWSCVYQNNLATNLNEWGLMVRCFLANPIKNICPYYFLHVVMQWRFPILAKLSRAVCSPSIWIVTVLKRLIVFSCDSRAPGCSVFKPDSKAELYIRALKSGAQSSRTITSSNGCKHIVSKTAAKEIIEGEGSARGRWGRAGNVIMA